MGLLLNRFKKFIKGYPTAVINSRVQGGIYVGEKPVHFGEFVVEVKPGYYVDIRSKESYTNNTSNLAIVSATNVKTTLTYGDKVEVETVADEAFNAFKEGFIALEVVNVKAKPGDAEINLIGNCATADGAGLATGYSAVDTDFRTIVKATVEELTSEDVDVYVLDTDNVSYAKLVKIDKGTSDEPIKINPMDYAFANIYVLAPNTHGASEELQELKFDKGIDVDSEGRILVNCYVDFR